MKIKTLTTYNVYNYGASLQAYALMKYLQNKGHEVEIIDYQPEYLRRKYDYKWVNPESKMSKYLLTRFVYRIMKYLQRQTTLKRKKAFDQFTDNLLKQTKVKYLNYSELKKNPPGKQFVFSGQYATINNEWCQPELITKIPPVYSDGDLLDSIVGISANEFKKRCINQYKRYVTHNNAQLQFSEDTRTLANLSCAFDCLENLQATHYCLQTAYQKKENITREQAFAAFLDVYLPDDFHNYLKDFPVNHPLALYCYNYRNVVMDLYDTHKDPLAYEKNLLKNAPLTKEEQTLIHQYETAFKAGISFQQESELMALSAKYFKENDLFRWESFSKAKERLSNIIQDSTSLIVDYIRAIYMRSSFYNLQPLTPRQELMASEITNPIFLGIIQDMNRQMQPRQKTITKKFTICEAPQVPEKELLTALIARHKGKVQFIDFWATWCGGCRQIIKEYEPLKKEIGEDKVAFIYLTGPSSIKKTWDILIQDIAGEHYWLNKEQWGYLWNHFQMTGLPMYLIIDKKGNIAKQFTHVTAKELKELLELEVNR